MIPRLRRRMFTLFFSSGAATSGQSLGVPGGAGDSLLLFNSQGITLLQLGLI